MANRARINGHGSICSIALQGIKRASGHAFGAECVKKLHLWRVASVISSSSLMYWMALKARQMYHEPSGQRASALTVDIGRRGSRGIRAASVGQSVGTAPLIHKEPPPEGGQLRDS